MKFHTRSLSIKAGKKVLCHELNLEIKPGEKWGVLGANGSGKTTLLQTLAGLRYQQNAIFINDRSLNEFTPTQLAQIRAILFQDTQFIFPQTVWDYCMTGRYPHRGIATQTADAEIVSQALAVVSLLSLKQCSVLQLSGGEKRRLAIAAVLAQQAQYYFLDEPLNHLDLRHQHEIMRFFQQSPASVFMSLHDVNQAQQYCNQILLIFENGEIQHGTPTEMLSDNNLSRLYGCVIQKRRDGFTWVPVT